MMKDDIKKAAAEYANEACRPLWRTGNEQVCMADFIEGAKWRINSVWHDANEIPKKNDSYIVVYNRFGIKTDFWSHYRGWEKYRRADKVKKWAYIEDLLPTKEDEQ